MQPPRKLETNSSITDFPSLTSVNGTWQNHLIAAGVIAWLLGLLLSLAGIPLAFAFGDDHWSVSYAKDSRTAVVFLLAYYGVFFYLVWVLWSLVRRHYTNAHDALRVDADGLHFLRNGHDIDRIGYPELTPVNAEYAADVTLEVRSFSTGNGGRVTSHNIGVRVKGVDGRPQLRRLDFRGGRLGRAYLYNRGELMAAYLRGLSVFRPDLRVSRSIYSHYFIDESSFVYLRRKRIWTEIAVWVLVLLVLSAIWLWI